MEEKYPRNIQRLFERHEPLLYKKPCDYAPEERSTRRISPLASLKQEAAAYKTQYPLRPRPAPKPKKQLHRQSQKRQFAEWEDTALFERNPFLKDPHCTVFVARLYYTFTEVELLKLFSKYGQVESVRLIRDKLGRSRGYGFVVFRRQADAQSCIRELAPTGLEVPPELGKPRRFLIDVERGRLERRWLPRRLGGGLGGRHYTLPMQQYRPLEAVRRPLFRTERHAKAQTKYQPLHQPRYQPLKRGRVERNDKYDKYDSRVIALRRER